MKIKFSEAVETEVEVNLPLFRKHVLDYSTVYTRIRDTPSGLEGISITIAKSRDDDHCEIEIDRPYRFDSRSPRDYQLAQGAYKSSAEEFADAVKRASEYLAAAQ